MASLKPARSSSFGAEKTTRSHNSAACVTLSAKLPVTSRKEMQGALRFSQASMTAISAVRAMDCSAARARETAASAVSLEASITSWTTRPDTLSP